ncbi:hypothetical protein [Phycicoccus avicenniae]|uniref:hypothetical protein n=1 Tax=Phycicoccus avicenniae TaxID=2828860 RepID=UPI003D298000
MDGGRDTPEVGDHIRRARDRAFIGRAAEIEVLGSALDGAPGAARVVWVHGPGGIGKTSLLHWVDTRARTLGRPVLMVDGRDLRSPDDLAAAFARAGQDPGAVVLVDTFEQCQWLESFLRDRVLPGVPADVLVVIAGRTGPDLQWVIDPGWAGTMHELAVGPLSRDDAHRLLSAGGLSRSVHDAVIRFAGGNPLTLSLAVAVAGSERTDGADWAPSAEVLRSLLGRLVGDVPDDAHRRTLEVAALAATTTEALLRVALPDQDTSTLFAWLRDQPYIDSSPTGLFPHDVVREALVADLKWRDRRALDAVRTRLGEHLLSRVRLSGEREAAEVMGDLLYLHRDLLSDAFGWDGRGGVADEPLASADEHLVRELAARLLGPEMAALVDHWLRRQPHAFVLYRTTDTLRPVGFSTRLTFAAPPEEQDLERDPVLREAWAYCRAVGLREGDTFAMARFVVHDPAEPAAAHARDLTYWLALARVARNSAICAGFLVYADPPAWTRRLGGAMLDTGGRVELDGREYALFGRDWRGYRFEDWLLEVVGAQTSEDARPAIERPDLDDAVREALGLWGRPLALAGTTLGRAVTPSTSSAEGEADPRAVDAAVRSLVRSALASMRGDERALQGHDAVVATYLSGPATQKGAARRLGVPFSTYRRHLSRGLDALTDAVWAVLRGGVAGSSEHH